MKRILCLSLALLTSLPIFAHFRDGDKDFGGDRREHGKVLAQYINDVEGKEIVEPKELIADWLQLKADKLNLAADTTQKFAQEIKGPKEKEAFLDIARDLKVLAQKYQDAPVPLEDVKKKLTNVADWLKLAARMKELKAKKFKLVAEQLDSRAAHKLAHKMKKKARMIQQALEYARQADSDDDNDDADSDED